MDSQEINKFIWNGEVLFDLTKDTVTPETLVQGVTAHDKSGKKIVGTMTPSSGGDGYSPDDEISTDISDEDYIPFYDVSASKKKNSLFSTIIDKLKTIFPLKTDLKAHTYEKDTEIPANANLNSYTTAGVYQCELSATAQTISNVPAVIAFKLIVMKVRKNANLIQWFVPYLASTSDAKAKVAWRTTDDGGTTWTSWVYLARTSDVKPSNIGDGFAESVINGTTVTASIDGFQLHEGAIVTLRINGTLNSACTLNINNTGAKPITHWSTLNPSKGNPLTYCIATFIYDGTQYRVISKDRVPRVGYSNYVADTSGDVYVEWGYESNFSGIKYDISSDKLKWYGYKNNGTTGNKFLADYDDIITQLGKAIPSNSNLNSYVTAGIYYCGYTATVQTISNIPCEVAFKLIVMKVRSDSNLIQWFIPYDTNANNVKSRIYRRSTDDGGTNWTSWVMMSQGENWIYTGSLISANSNLNDYKTEGVYYIDTNVNAATISNMPVPYAGKLVVMSMVGGGTYRTQMFIPYYPDYKFGAMYVRGYTNNDSANTWSQWLRIASGRASANEVLMYAETTTADDKSVGIRGQIKDTTTGKEYSNTFLQAYNDHQDPTYGFNTVLCGGGALFLGSGEAGDNHYAAIKPISNENMYITSDAKLLLQACDGNIANRLGIMLDTNGNITPIAGDNLANETINIGTTSCKFANVNTRYINGGRPALDSLTTQIVGGIGMKYINIPDNSGWLKFLKMCDITTWYNSTTTGQQVQSFEGWLISSREGGYVTDDKKIEISVAVAYEKVTEVNRQSLRLYTSDPSVMPAIMKEVLNGVTKYYLVLGFRGSGRNAFLLGRFRMNDGWANAFINTWVNCTDANDTLPTGYSVVMSGRVMRRHAVYGTCTTGGGDQIKYVEVYDPTYELRTGDIVGVRFSNTNTYNSTTSAPCQLNVNNTGAKNIYYGTTHSGAGNTGTNTMIYGYANRTYYYMYDGTYWVWISAGYEQTYNPQSLGFGYGTCTDGASVTARAVTLSSYNLVTHGLVAVRFDNDVPASATLNINGKGAKSIYHQGAALGAGVIKGGDRVLFAYDGTYYHLVASSHDRKIFANYRYADSAGTPSTTYLTRNDTDVLFTEVSTVRRGDTVMISICAKYTSSKTYSANTKIATLAYASAQVCYPHDRFFISGNVVYARNGTFNGYYYLQCTYIVA